MTASKRESLTAEERRLEETRDRTKHWKRWGPYVSERAWGTVREDYSAGGTAWDYFPHDHARSRAYRWNEDGLAGICDRHQKICFALALWNGHDPILKERIFGLTGSEGNHGEDVKEYYFYVDSTPTHSYMKYLYKYPQAEFPYSQLVDENRSRGKLASEFELIDTGIFNEDRYFDVVVQYAKAEVEDILIKITATNYGPDAALINLLPTIWFRNTWSWNQNGTAKPSLRKFEKGAIELEASSLGKRWLYCEESTELLFTENDTNTQRLFNSANDSHFVCLTIRMCCRPIAAQRMNAGQHYPMVRWPTYGFTSRDHNSPCRRDPFRLRRCLRLRNPIHLVQTPEQKWLRSLRR